MHDYTSFWGKFVCLIDWLFGCVEFIHPSLKKKHSSNQYITNFTRNDTQVLSAFREVTGQEERDQLAEILYNNAEKLFFYNSEDDSGKDEPIWYDFSMA